MLTLTLKTNPSQGVRFVNLLPKRILTLRKKLSHFLLFSLLVFCVFQLSATNYYVSSSGNDSNTGTSESLPWKSLAKVNSFTPKPGDQILFKRGDEWSGSITVNASGTSSSRIIYGAYGSGNKPKIYGSEKITGWSQYSGNIYKSSLNATINQLFINDKRAKAARFPNTGWFLTTSVNNETQFTCNSLNAGINYIGAKLIIKTNEWRLDTRDVTSSISQTISINSNLVYKLEKGRPFILTNKLEFLDQPGEWYYDNNTKTVYLWTPNGDSPSNYNISGSIFESGVVISGKNYITVRDLDILQHAKIGIDAYNSNSNIIIDNNDINNIEIYGIKSQGAENIISNNKVDGINSIGIFAWNSTNGQVLENTILNTGIFENIGVNGMAVGYTAALPVSGNGQTVKNNRIIGCGYIGINFSGFNTTVENNYIENTCSILFDGGAIYSWSSNINVPTVTGSVIKNNIIQYNNGTAAIFMDDRTQNVVIEGNTIAHTSGSRYHETQAVTYAIFLINNKNVTIKNNTLFNNSRGWSLKGTYDGNIFNNNIVCNIKSTPNAGYLAPLLAQKNASHNNCNYDYNIYIDRNRTKAFRFDDTGVNNVFNDWKAGIKGDVNSRFIGTALTTGETEELFYNDSKQTKTFNLGIYKYIDIYGKQSPQSFTLEPFTSKILIKTTTPIIADTTSPVVTAFTIPATSSSLTVLINSLTATDNIAVTGYMITETSTIPNSSNSNWSTNEPTSYNFTSEGTKTLYAWSKDAAGNISESVSKQVVISLSANSTKLMGNIEVSSLVSIAPNRRAMPVTFSEKGMIESISIYHNGGTGNVLFGVYSNQANAPSSQLGATGSTIINTFEGWQTVSLTNPVPVTSGQTVWLSWVFQNNPGIRYFTGAPARAQSTEAWSAGMPLDFSASSFAEYNYSIYCSYSTENELPALPDVTKPVVTAFTVPSSSSTFIVPVNSFTASDNIAVTGFMITESSSAPYVNSSAWNSTAPSSYSFVSEGTKLLFAWTKDAAGNVSASKTAQVVITLSDVTKPVITAFTIPTTSSSLTVPVNSFTVTDNIAVTGFMITESSSAPNVNSTAWNSTAPSSYSFVSEGTKSLFSWTKDAAGNVSASKTAQVVITLPDVTKPVITAFTIPSTSSSLNVDITSFTATDNKTVTGFLLTESPATPNAASANWTVSAPTSYAFTSEGTKTLYAWTKDAAGNISESLSAQIDIVLPTANSKLLGKTEVSNLTSTTANRRAISVTSKESGIIESISIYHNGGTGNMLLGVYADQAGAPSVQLGVTASTLINSTSGWQTVSLKSPVLVNSGQTIWLSWVFQNNPGIRYYIGTPARAQSNETWTGGMPATFGSSSFANYNYSIYCTYSTETTIPTLPDTSAPTISEFSIPATSTSLNVNIISFIANDNSAITGYMLTESSETPNTANIDWSISVPTSYTFTSEGTKTLYAWTKDAAGNVSKSKSAQVVIDVPDVIKPVIISFSIPDTVEYLTVPITSFYAVDDKEVTGYMLTETDSCPSISNDCWTSTAPETYTFPDNDFIAVSSSSATIANDIILKSGTQASNSYISSANKTLYAWTKDAAGNISNAETDEVLIIFPDIEAPEITEFTIQTSSSSLTVDIINLKAIDNVNVTGLILTETSIIPDINDERWNDVVPVSYTFTTVGTKTLYAWAKDAAGNISLNKNATVVISLPDFEKPVITVFTIPTTSSTLTVNINSLIATDNIAVSGFMITESATQPSATNSAWGKSVPTSYTLTNEGTKTLYAWVKDSSGNISNSKSANVVISIPSKENTSGITEVFTEITTTANRRAVPVSFTEKSEIESVSIFHNGGTGNMLLGVYSDNNGVPSSLLGVTTSTTLNTTEGWQTVPLISTVLVNPGQTVWLSWVFQTNPGIRYSVGTPARAQSNNLWSSGMPSDFGNSGFANYKYSIFCTYTTNLSKIVQTDITKPTITSFSIPTSSSSLEIAINIFQATDNTGITGFKLTETPSEPDAREIGWNEAPPTSYHFDTEGIKTVYAWVKDAAGNVSTYIGKEVVITLPKEDKLPEEQTTTQSIELKKGWNIFSTYLVPTNESMDSVTETLQLNEDLNIVQDKYSNTLEKCPVTHNWINKIGKLQKPEGYLVKVESDCTLDITGEHIQLPLNININRGWNIISFPIDGSIDAMQIVQPLIDAGIIYKIQDERGNSIENWKNLGWKNGIGNFNGGEGYIVQANKNGTLIINELTSKSSSNFTDRTETTYFRISFEGNGINHMNINLKDLKEADFQVGDEIAAYDGDICVGAVKISEFDITNNTVGIAVSASELHETIGFTEGNPIELKAWKNENGEESKLLPEVTEGKMIFNKQASVFASLNSQSTNVTNIFDNLKIEMYPNPASSNVSIRFSSLPSLGTKITLLNITGNVIHSRMVENTQEILNIQHLPAGIYLVKTELNNNYNIQKLIKK